jgi:hypothetical protein
LIKTNVPAPSSSQAAPNKKRQRGAAGNDKENKENHNWRWGARSIEEIGEDGIVEFITAFMVDKHDLIEEVEDDSDGTPGGNAARYQQRKADEAEAMKKSIMKAAMTAPTEDD